MKQVNFNLKFLPETNDIECSATRGVTREEYEDMVGTLIMSIYRHYQSTGDQEEAEAFRATIEDAVSSPVFWNQYCSCSNDSPMMPHTSVLKS